MGDITKHLMTDSAGKLRFFSSWPLGNKTRSFSRGPSLNAYYYMAAIVQEF